MMIMFVFFSISVHVPKLDVDLKLGALFCYILVCGTYVTTLQLRKFFNFGKAALP